MTIRKRGADGVRVRLAITPEWGGGVFNGTRAALPPLELETPETQCPRCGEWIVDHDGFGVLRHEACNYCSHISRTGGVCELCGDVQKL
jgi:hypothetical protein